MAQPPVGTYDPALDAQAAAAQRGYGDLQADYETGNLRDTVDYGLGRDAIGRDYGRNSADLGTQLQRALGGLGTDYRYGSEDLAQALARGTQDLGTARTQGQEDYGSSVAMLQRQYRQLGSAQQQQQNAAGVLRGGAALQAAVKRAENESLERQPIDTSFNRFLSDNTLQQGRLGEDVGRGQTRLTEGFNTQTGQLNEDYATQTGRLGEDRDLALASLALGLAPPDASNPLGGRSFQDRTTALTRAGRENTEFGQDVNAQRFYQATQGGWNPPPPPQVAPARPAPRGFPSVTGGSWALAAQRQQPVFPSVAGGSWALAGQDPRTRPRFRW
jgi:hypothetical protein